MNIEDAFNVRVQLIHLERTMHTAVGSEYWKTKNFRKLNVDQAQIVSEADETTWTFPIKYLLHTTNRHL